MDKRIISVVIPIYNEKEILRLLVDKLQGVAKEVIYNFEFIFVNDGSHDGSLEALLDLGRHDPRIKIIDFSRNFGQQIAVTAGIDFAQGDAVILMDADMEDRPQDLPKFIRKWEEGYDVVYAVRKKRKTSLLRKICFSAFHYLNRLICEIPIEPAGIFGLMDRKVTDKIKIFTERNRYMPGLRSWIGFRQTGIELERGGRYDRKPRVSFIKLLSLAFNSYFSFSTQPLKIASFLGILFSLITFISAVLIAVLRILINFRVPGWASIMVIVLFIASMQFICIGIMGEYLGRIYDETKRRPLYILNNLYGIKEE